MFNGGTSVFFHALRERAFSVFLGCNLVFSKVFEYVWSKQGGIVRHKIHQGSSRGTILISAVLAAQKASEG